MKQVVDDVMKEIIQREVKEEILEQMVNLSFFIELLDTYEKRRHDAQIKETLFQSVSTSERAFWYQ